MKSFENIIILFKVKLFCLKNLSFGKSFHLKNVFEKKIKKMFFLRKKLFENIFFEKNFFAEFENFQLKKVLLKKFGKKIFSPLVPKSPGA